MAEGQVAGYALSLINNLIDECVSDFLLIRTTAEKTGIHASWGVCVCVCMTSCEQILRTETSLFVCAIA